MTKLSVSDEVYENLVTRLFSKEWNLGDKIPSEHQLCQEYSVSRISVRSAIQKLQTKGLIVTRPGKGSFVIANSVEKDPDKYTTKLNFSQNEYKYFIEFRRAIEFYCVDLMCIRGTAEDFENLQSGLEMMKSSDLNSDDFKNGDILFHTSIIRGSHNPMFISILDSSIDEYKKYMVNANVEKPNSYDATIENHTRIFNAIISRDAKKARNILESTVEFNIRKFKDSFSDK